MQSVFQPLKVTELIICICKLSYSMYRLPDEGYVSYVQFIKTTRHCVEGKKTKHLLPQEVCDQNTSYAKPLMFKWNLSPNKTRRDISTVNSEKYIYTHTDRHRYRYAVDIDI